jgi:hypothetical protein
MKILFRSITAFAIALWVITASAGIYVDKVDHPKKVVVLKIEGRIKYEDDLQFQKILDEIKSDGYKIKLNSVVLNTAGGSPSAAIAIGKIIRKENLNTYVGPKHHCGSACIYILSSGIIRMAYGEVTVHQNKRSDFLKLSKFAALTALGLTKKANQNRRLMSKNIGDRFRMISASKIYEKTSKNL